MIQLERIHLVHFFLFEKESIHLGRISAVFGPNGSGKSALIDAIQIALFGGNSRLCVFNAQADDSKKTTRTIRDYCLGQFGQGPEQRARDNALTYVTLVWRDTKTGRPTTTGVCLRASSDRPGHEVEGRYLLRDIELSLSEHIEVVENEEHPLAWPTFRRQLAEKSKITGDEYLYQDSERYIQAVMLALRGSSGHAPDASAFKGAFRFGLRMRFDKTIDEIIRTEVLEANPTNVNKFKEVVESFRHLADLVARVEKKLAEGEAIHAEYFKADTAGRHAMTWQGLSVEVDHEIAGDEVSDARGAVTRAAEALTSSRNDLAGKEAELKSAETQATSFQNLREQHPQHAEHGALQSAMNEKNAAAEKKSGDLRDSLAYTRHLLDQATKVPELKKMTGRIREGMTVLDTLDVQKVSRSDLGRTLETPLDVVGEVIDEIKLVSSKLQSDIETTEGLIKDANTALQRVGAGKPPLDDDVQRLMTEFTDHGLNPTPVCDVVKITQSEWQPVIESYLGRRLQTLLVPANQKQKAFSIYRALSGRRAIYGVKVAAESTAKLNISPPDGSVAELIEGTHDRAVEYLQSIFGNMKRAETDKEAASGRHTLTRDGMIVKGDDFERIPLRREHELRLGIDTGSRRPQILKELETLSTRLIDLNKHKLLVDGILEGLMRVGRRTDSLPFLLRVFDEMSVLAHEAEHLSERIHGDAAKEYLSLGKQQEECSNEARTLQVLCNELRLKVGGSENHLLECQNKEKVADQKRSAIKAQLIEAKANPLYDAEYAQAQWEGMIRLKIDYLARKNHCEEKVRNAIRLRDQAIQAATRLLTTYSITHTELPPGDEDWKASWVWITDMNIRLRDTELHEYREQMDDAYRASQETFSNDVATALSERLDLLDSTLHRLNAALKSCPLFTNSERYQFRKIIRPHLKPLLDFVKDVATHGPSGDLFGRPGQLPEQFRELLDDKVALGAGGVSSPLDDYREFFEFDIEILREDKLTKQLQSIGQLSKRLGPGSGGEHRSPLYVIAGAALASAYRMDAGNQDGMRFIMLDEAFNKMDMNNIVSTMQYLIDLGFQVFMGSPGENEGILMAFIDRYYDILKDPVLNAVALEGHNVATDINEMHREDLIEFHPELLATETARIRATPVLQQ